MLALAGGAAMNLAVGQAALVCTALVLVVRACTGDDRVLRVAQDLRPALCATLFFLVACLLSNLLTPAAWPGAFEATRWRALVAIPVGALALGVRGPRLAWWCAAVFAVGCGVHGGVGLYQALTGDSPFADVLGVPLSKRSVPAPGIPGLRSAVGFFYNRVRLSHVLAAGVAVGVGIAVLGQRARVVVLASSCVALMGLVATFGRAALMALMVTLAVAAAIKVLWGNAQRRGPRLLAASVALVTVMAGVLAVPPARARLSTGLSISQNQDRLFLWGRGAEMAMDHAPVGTGLGGYAVVRDAYYDRVNDSIQSRAMSHNLLLSLLAETGLLGLLAWLWMWWALLKRAWRAGSPVALAGMLGAASFHAATMAHDPLYQSECALAWGLCGALMASPPEAGGDGGPQTGA